MASGWQFVGQREGGVPPLSPSPPTAAPTATHLPGHLRRRHEYSPDGKVDLLQLNRSGSWHVWRMPADGAGPRRCQGRAITSDESEELVSALFAGWKTPCWWFPSQGHQDPQRRNGMALSCRLMPAPGEKPEPASWTSCPFLRRPGHHQRHSWSARFAPVRLCRV